MSAYHLDTMDSVGSALGRPIRWILQWFTAHPNKKGMTYGEHLRRAWYMAWRMGYGASCLFLHGLFPAYFPTTGSTIVKRLYQEIRGEEEKEKERDSEKHV